MAAIESLIGNLSADDLSTRLYAVLTLHDRRDEPELAPKLKAAAECETDPALKLYLTWLADPQSSGAPTTLQSLNELIRQPVIDWVAFFYALHRIDRQTAAQALPLIRKIDSG
ncbi:MAG TPA: hypothetical protein PKM56_19500, partial [Candidatus Rifleibacterium sp.]|nr:hypothetical protein [Candidatus Rifleibacterium sp.]